MTTKTDDLNLPPLKPKPGDIVRRPPAKPPKGGK
jgi:hypothetical protein